MRVVLAGERTSDQSGLRRLLEREPELNVVSTVSSARDLPTYVKDAQPEVLLLDWELQDLQSTDLLSVLRALYRPLKIVAFSSNRGARNAAMAAGADAFVSRDEPLEWLLTTLRALGRLSPHL
jgi:two-component system invasion response regulator UvrY